MIKYNEFNKFPKDIKDSIIHSVFASNISSEIDRIKKDLEENKNKSEFMEVLLESITLKYNNPFGRFYEVTGLYCIPQKTFGIDLEEDNE